MVNIAIIIFGLCLYATTKGEAAGPHHGQPLHTPAARGGGAELSMTPRVAAADMKGGTDGG